MKPIKVIQVLLAIVLAFNLNAQLDITDGNTPPYNPQNLVRNVFLGSGVEVTDINYIGDARSVGYFTGGDSRINLERGIVLSTGFAQSINKPNVTFDDNGDIIPGVAGQDPDLAAIAGDAIDDIAMYTIKFIPSSDTLRFRYVFASEEYPGYICEINDVFGFFVTGPNPDGGSYNAQNIALVPDPSDPSGLTFTNTPVSINNVHEDGGSLCPAQFPMYYNEIPIGTENFQMNAFLDVFTAEVIVIPCEEYTIKLGVADASDDILNSAVFLEAKSFGTGTLEVSLNSLSVDGSLAEGCESGELEFLLPEIVDEDYIINIDFLNPSNAATPDVDFPAIPGQLVIPAGSKSVTVPLEAYLDGESEGDEVIAFEIQVDLCNRRTFEIILRDDNLLRPILPDDLTICQGEDLLIDSELDPSFNLPPDPYFENTTPFAITPEMDPIYSDIIVAGVIPTMMTPNIIESVCITGLEHRDLTDFDIYLIAPGGQILELSTDNGFKEDNIADVDRFENTCFTPFASENINNGNNLVGPIFDANPTYTGDFLPEGVWSDLWDGQNPTNGTWRLLVIDDFTGFEGTLEGWSITFRSYYNLTYEWTSNPTSTLCSNCEDIMVSPSQTTEYTLNLIDSYGCGASESIMVTVESGVEKPVVSCGASSQNSLEVTWGDIAGATGYEVRIDGGVWVTLASTELNNTFNGLQSSTDFLLEVRALGPNCASEIAGVMCRTDDCAKPNITIAIDEEVTCPGGTDGLATFAAMGNGPFSFELNGETNSTGIFTNIPVGQNTILVTDNLACSEILDFNMPGPVEFTLNTGYRLSDACNVVSDITGSVNVSGGSPPYMYQWSNLATGQEAFNLTPGTYNVTVTDSKSCSETTTLVIPELEQFIFNVSTTAPSCKDGGNGMAVVVEISGTGPYTYLWEDGSTQAFNENLEAGFYVVTVTDILGCSIPNTFTIEEGEEVEIEVVPVDVSCKGQNDGSASISVNGGVAPFTYSWSSGNSSASTVEDLSPGTYMVTVRDVNDCETIETFTINEPDGMSYAISSQENLCFGEEDGSISITDVTSPNGNVSILWNSGETSFERINLVSGEYCFTLSDGTVCTLSDCVTISSPDEIDIEENISEPNCEFSEDGSIELVITGGITPYTFEWNGPKDNLPGDQIINELPAGTYNLTVTDGNECTSTKEITVNPATPILTSPTVFEIACKGESTGQILFSVSGGQPPFNFNWTGPNNFVASTNNIMGLSAGVYNVTYTDARGCQGTQEFLVNEPSLPLMPNISLGDTICFGTANGSLTVNPSGGTPPYQLQWSNNTTSELNAGLAPGTYSVTITDSRSCTMVASSSVIENGEIEIEIDAYQSSCFQTNDGSAEIVDILKDGQSQNLATYNITWNTSPTKSTLLAEDLIGGQTYIALVEDRFGCLAQKSILIPSPEEVGAEIGTINHVSCFNESDGSIIIQGTGGTGNYSYQWGGNANAATTNEIDMLRMGTYAVTISDENGCLGYSNYTIEEPRPLSMEFRVIDVNCFGGNDGRAEVVVQGGTGPYNYEWTNESTEKAIENVVAQQYNITVTDVNNCTLTDSTRVNEPEEDLMVELEIEDVSCFEGRNGKIQVEATGGSGFYQYSIDGVEFSQTNIFTNLTAGNYELYVSDFKGCRDTIPEAIVFEPEPLIVNLGEDIVIPFGTTTTLSSLVENNSGAIAYNWFSDNIELLSCTNCPNPIFDGQREASFELVVTDSKGCSGNDFVTIRLQNFSPLFVPSAFTPNGDGENDVLKLFGKGIDIVENFMVYDRWGELVFVKANLEIGEEELHWNGLFKGNHAPSGVYYWVAEVLFNNGFSETYKGETTLLR